MAKKHSLGMIAGAVAAVGAGLLASPSAQQVVTTETQQAQQTQVVQSQQQRQQARMGQQQAQQQQVRTITSSQAFYLPWRPGYDRVYGKFTLTPREYGEYLARSGKNKYNGRRRKHFASMRS